MIRTKFLLLIISPFLAGLLTYFYMDTEFHVIEYFSELVKKSDIEENEENKIIKEDKNKEDIYGLKTSPFKTKFDIIQVSPDGQLVIAGKAKKKSKVELLIGSEVISNTIADDKGEFVFIIDSKLSAGAYEIILKATDDDGKISISNSATALIPEKKNKSSVALLYNEKDEVVEVIKPNISKDSTLRLNLETMIFDEKDNIIISGTGEKMSTILVYIDNNLVSNIKANSSGKWQASINIKIREGSHLLRLDQFENDKIVSRIEKSFIKLSNVFNVKEGKTVVIDSGDTLWAIARNIYGKGINYISIFEANLKDIKDPDLIYPGQIFIIPSSKSN